MPELRTLARNEVAEAGRLLGRAFVDNPAQLAALARLSAARRARVVEALHASFCAAAVGHWTAGALFDDRQMLGVMLVLAQGVYPPSPRARLTALRGALGAGFHGMRNYIRIDEHMTALHPREPHQYLCGGEPGSVVAVDRTAVASSPASRTKLSAKTLRVQPNFLIITDVWAYPDGN